MKEVVPPIVLQPSSATPFLSTAPPPTQDTPAGQVILSSLLSQGDYLIRYGFTGKPLTLGGAAYPHEVRHQNRLQWCQVLNLRADRLAIPHQVHGYQVDTSDAKDLTQTDGLIVSTSHTPVMVLTADCVPILLYDPTTHTGAVVHAGWRGTSLRIAEKAVQQLQAKYEVNPANLIAVIGPSISGPYYPVGPNVVEALAHTLENASNTPLESWLIPGDFNEESLPPNPDPGKPRVDVATVNGWQLHQCGVRQLERLPYCTALHRELFFSHRHGETGRQGVFLELLDNRDKWTGLNLRSRGWRGNP